MTSKAATQNPYLEPLGVLIGTVNALGYLRSMFTVEDIDDTVSRPQEHGAELVGEIAQYENLYRLCYIRGPEQILIGLAEELNKS